MADGTADPILAQAKDVKPLIAVLRHSAFADNQLEKISFNQGFEISFAHLSFFVSSCNIQTI